MMQPKLETRNLKLETLRNFDRGNTIIEFALATTLILTILFGIIDVGRAAYAYDWTANAARKGARFMIVRGNGCVNDPNQLPGGCPATTQNAIDYIKNTNGNGLDTTGIDTSQVLVNTSCWSTNAVHFPPPCPISVPISVQVQYTFRFVSPFAPFSWNMQSASQQIVQN